MIASPLTWSPSSKIISIFPKPIFPEKLQDRARPVKISVGGSIKISESSDSTSSYDTDAEYFCWWACSIALVFTIQ